jgi:hypothetical protein
MACPVTEHHTFQLNSTDTSTRPGARYNVNIYS